MYGKIHSVESMGLSDGPGIRYIIFLQGCELRCAYCHNPDTWDKNGGELITAKELIDKAIRFKPYFKASRGGVTISGGEPLLQPEFLIELLKGLKEVGIHTCLDTAGYGLGNYNEILKYVDLVLLDIKHVNKKGYRELVNGDMDRVVQFIDTINTMNVKTRVRHVVMPGINDTKEHLINIKSIAMVIKNLEGIELLPYHELGKNKYDEMGIKYRLEGLRAMEEDELKVLESYIG